MPGGDFSTVFDGTVSDPDGSGTFSVALVSGQNYTMTLGKNGNISSDGGLSGTAGRGLSWTGTSATTRFLNQAPGR